MAPATIEEISSSCPTQATSNVDKVRLAKVVGWQANVAVSHLDFSWGKQIPHDEINLSTLQFQELGDVQVPVSAQDFKRLKEIASESPYGKGLHESFNPSVRLAWEIDSSQFASTLSGNFGLSTLISLNMNLPKEAMDIHMQLDKLILYETGGHYQRSFVSDNSSVFGTAILQIPVEGGHEGGRFKVQYKGIEKHFENHQCSQQKFYTTVFFNGCEHSMEPVTRGSKLTLVFNLVCVNAKNLPSQDVSVFLSSLKDLESILVPWIRLQNPSFEADAIMSSDKDEVVASTSSSTPAIASSQAIPDQQVNVDKQLVIYSKQHAANSETSSDDSTSSDDTSDVDEQDEDENETLRHCLEFLNSKVVKRMFKTNVSTLNEENLEENVLFFVLNEKYDRKCLAFHRLQGKDRDLANLLQSCKFIDVHLAEVTNKLTITSTDEEESLSWGWGGILYNNSSDDNVASQEQSNIKISRWIDSNDVTRDLSLEMNWLKQCVGKYGNLLSTKHKPNKEITISEDDGDKTIEVKTFFHNILVIWPKFQTTRLYCQHGLQSLLDRIENSVGMLKMSWIRTRQEIQQEIIRDVQEIISFWYENPQKVWRNKNMTREELTLKLIQLCTDLRTRDEGLRLLKALGTTTIPNENLARAIAEFECQVTGWEDCADYIKQLISSDHVPQNLFSIVVLAKCLLDVSCVEGANMLGAYLSSAFAKINKHHASSLKLHDLNIYVDYIIAMEACPETSNPKRLTSFSSFFTKLDFLVQYQVVRDLEANDYSRLKGIQSCRLLFHYLCQALAMCNLHVPSIKIDTVIDLMIFYVRVGNTEHVRLFISNLCRMCSNTTANNLVGKLISSSSIWDLALSSELGKTVVTSLTDHQLVLLANQLSVMPKPCQKPLDQHHKIDSCPLHIREETFKSSLSSCIKLIMKMERNIQMADSKRVASVSSLLSKLGVAQLCHLLVDIHKTGNERLSKHPSSLIIIRQICELLLTRGQKVTSMLNRRLILETIGCFTQLCDETFRRSLIETICKNELAGTWSLTNKYLLFSELITSTEIWSKLETCSKLLVLNTCSTLVETWIVEILRLLMDSTANPGQVPQPIDVLRVKISNCAHLFILAEKNRFDPLQKTAVVAFQPVFAKLTINRLLDLVVDLYVIESKAVPNLKNFSFCLNWYRDVCRLFFSQDFTSLFGSKCEVIVNIMRVLLWLNDDQCWNSFALKVCNGLPVGHSHFFVRFILERVDIQQTILESPLAFTAFNQIVNHATELVKFVKDPPLNWKQPNAIVIGHPDVEVFLRSNQETAFYSKFNGIAEARRFATQLEKMCSANGYSVKVTTSGTGKSSRCSIVKKLSIESLQNQHQIRKSELEELVKLRQTLQERAKVKMGVAAMNQQATPVANAGTSNGVYILLPPAKRSKLEIL